MVNLYVDGVGARMPYAAHARHCVASSPRLERSRWRQLAGSIIVSFATATAALAQDTANLTTSVSRMLVAGDTVSAIAALASAPLAEARTAAQWHELAMMSSAATRRWWRQSYMPSGVPEVLDLARKSFERALSATPNDSWRLDFAHFMLYSSVTNISKVEATVEPVLRSPDASLVSAASDLLGLVEWRRYEVVSKRRLLLSDVQTRLAEFIQRPATLRDFLQLSTQSLHPPIGEDMRRNAERRFRTAVNADKSNGLAFRHVAMLLADGERWDELARESAKRIANDPRDAWGHLALGLARHRLHTAQSGQSLARGFELLPEGERLNLLRTERVTSPDPGKDSVPTAFAARAQFSAAFWNTANPSTLVAGNLVYEEFQARVVHAQLRWSNEETGLSGVDSDRGDVFVRWGPPEVSVTLKDPNAAEVLEVWSYERYGFNYVFNAMPTYGTARMVPLYRSNVLEHVSKRFPATWANISGIQILPEHLLPQVLRFRGESTPWELSVRTAIPSMSPRETDRLNAQDSSRVRVSVFNTLWNAIATRDTVIPTARGVSMTALRIPVPESARYIRVDALGGAPDADPVAAKGLRDVEFDSPRGFGLSDVALGNARVRSTPSARRWYDVPIVPPPSGVYRRGDPIHLVWEVYEATNTDGRAKYRVAIRTERIEAGGLRGVAARIASGARAAIGDASSDRTTLRFDREVPHAPALLDHIAISLQDQAAGSYRVTISITDQATGRVLVRTHDIRLGN